MNMRANRALEELQGNVGVLRQEQQAVIPVRSMIRGCKSMKDILQAYDDPAIQRALGHLSAAVGQDNLQEWAKQWAIRMRQEGDEDRVLNYDRGTVLLLLQRLVERWRQDDEHTVTDDSIVSEFGRERIANIFRVALIMDKMQCLYKMQYPGESSRYGMHWVAKQHINENWTRTLTMLNGSATMNNKYVALLEHYALELHDMPFIVDCLQPQERPAIENP